ncbi:alpha/beta hydrolase [Paucibacter sp. AS339]|uniref:alpha/beta fold hydrolase n=1 Tax=Paucibacter hankyongi TaxID=3133434 RepID=UPI0030A7DEF8
MSDAQLKFVNCLGQAGLHRMAYWEWACRAELPAGQAAPVLVCVHGLSRQGRDFDALARALSSHYRVICPDVAGRGQSDCLANPAAYQIPSYVADMVTLLARLDVDQVDWVGTSMGGLIGMGLAALQGGSAKTMVRRLVLNDVGPQIEFDSLRRIGTYLGQNMVFSDVQAGTEYLKSISAGFGPHSDAQWAALSAPMFKPEPGTGQWRLHYDPRIALPFGAVTPELAQAGSSALWQVYDALRCPTLLLRGAESDLLSAATAQAMAERGPRAEVQELPGVGHAPTLVQPDQIERVRAFLGAV